MIAERRGPSTRYRLLETVRQSALERLAVAGEEEALRSRHLDAFLALAEEAGPQLETGAQREWLELLDPEAANLAAAIDYALRTEPPLGLRFCPALRARAVASRRLSWRTRARWTPARTASRRCARAPAKAAPTSPSGRATTKRRRRTRPRRWRSRRRLATAERRRGRAAI